MGTATLHAHHHQSGTGVATWFWLAIFIGLALLYGLATLSPRHKTAWPWHRSLLWTGGLLCAGSAVIGPIANQASGDFRQHMLGHLLLGMLAPILLALAAPVTLALRALPVSRARRLAHLLGSAPLRVLTHPMSAALLNIGGLWLLYTTRLFQQMHGGGVARFLIEWHLLAAGYLFTAAMIGIDPIRHRSSWMVRCAVLIVALAGHAILAKYLVTHPPAGVAVDQVEPAARLMYYGGDAVELVLITLFCAQWYQKTRPRGTTAEAAETPSGYQSATIALQRPNAH